MESTRIPQEPPQYFYDPGTQQMLALVDGKWIGVEMGEGKYQNLNANCGDTRCLLCKHFVYIKGVWFCRKCNAGLNPLFSGITQIIQVVQHVLEGNCKPKKQTSILDFLAQVTYSPSTPAKGGGSSPRAGGSNSVHVSWAVQLNPPQRITSSWYTIETQRERSGELRVSRRRLDG